MENLVEGGTADLADAPTLPAPHVSPTPGAETILAGVLAEVLQVEHVPADGDFFDELGADSMVMARFCARVRKRGDLPSISMKDVYGHPTIRSLAAALAEVAPSSVEPIAVPPVEAPTPASTREYTLCGVLQTLCFLCYAYVAAFLLARGYGWISSGSGPFEIYLRAVAVGVAGFLIVGSVPIFAKWILIGRWKSQQIRIWSLGYVRFWIVKTLTRFNPCAPLLVGSPLYSVYLRALGAKVGPGVVVFSRRVPICTDLLTIGAGSVIRRESFFQCYRAHAGRIEIGPVTLGRDVFVGEKTVLDINTSIGDGAQLGHASSLHAGQAIPDGGRWHGSPAQPTEVNYLRVAAAECGTLRRAGFGAVTLLAVFLVYLPLVWGGLYLLGSLVPSLNTVLDPSAGTVVLGQLLIAAAALSGAIFFGAVLVGLPLVVFISRALNAFIVPDKVYPLYGFHDRVQRTIARVGRIRLFTYLFGDSSYIVHYLGGLGSQLTPVEQTGSNFGIDVIQANPCLSSVGTGTMVADGLVVVNDEVSSTSFCVCRASIGRNNFLGNDVTYPAGGRTGENCLLATKAMVPLDGEIHEGVGLLGSPPFEIPRTVDRDTRFDHLRRGEALRRGLAAKNRYNLRTIGIFLVARWLGLFVVVLLDLAAFDVYGTGAHMVMAALFALSLVVSALYFALVERCMVGFGSLRPTYCSIYHRDFWLHERLWKVPAMQYLHVFDGTPFKGLVWRLMGVRVGKRLFDDGTHVSDRTLTAIGDDCVLNLRSRIQCHSEEDATFKSDRTTLGDGCTIGVAAVVLYGVTMGHGAVLAPDSFLLKGEEIPAQARWGGNPAREM